MIDAYGLYVQANGGNGDSAHRTGLAIAISELIGERDDTITKARNAITEHLEVSPGIFIRHPADYPGDWSANTNNFSRDQASRIILAAAITGNQGRIKRWLWQMAKRGFFHQNNMDPTTNEKKIPDIMAPGEWCNVIRGLDAWYAYPVLVVLDALFIVDIYTRKPWDGASLYVPDLKFALKKFWTPTAWLANKLNNRTPWLAEALNNHSAAENGCVELQPLFEKLAEIN